MKFSGRHRVATACIARNVIDIIIVTVYLISLCTYTEGKKDSRYGSELDQVNLQINSGHRMQHLKTFNKLKTQQEGNLKKKLNCVIKGKPKLNNNNETSICSSRDELSSRSDIAKVDQYPQPTSYFFNQDGRIKEIPKQDLKLAVEEALKRKRSSEELLDQLPGSYENLIRNETPILPRAQYLPSGPPPFRPSTLMLGLSSTGSINKLKETVAFKKMYKTKLHYLFLDILNQLTILADKLARKKIQLSASKLHAIQTLFNKLSLKGKHSIKLKWPLVMLNPNFLKELLASPTFLVMLFHTIEVAYMSMPINFWLKPLMKLIAQPGPDKEEEIWWRRKRIYDTLNGHRSSELQPNLKTKDFKFPGEPTPVAIPKLTNIIRQIRRKSPPNPALYKQPIAHQQPISNSMQFWPNEFIGDHNNLFDMRWPKPEFQNSHLDDSIQQASANNIWNFEDPEHDIGKLMQPMIAQSNRLLIQGTNQQENWLVQAPTSDQLMSKQEFDNLDKEEKDIIFREAHRNLEESSFTNELIKQHQNMIDYFTNDRKSKMNLQNDQTNMEQPLRMENHGEQSKEHSITSDGGSILREHLSNTL